jgi:hypothetical protein
MEIESAARRYLLSLQPVTGYVGQKVFKFRLQEPIEGTGGLAIVVNRQSGWAAPEQIGTTEKPRLSVDCWADPTRVVGSGEIQALDAEDKAYALARVVRPYFCYPYLRNVFIGAVGSNPGLRVVDSDCNIEPRLLEDHATDRGDTVTVRIEFALSVQH